MNFKKMMLALGTLASFGLVACGSDSSSSGPESDRSSSSAEHIVLPESNGDSLITVSSFKAGYATATSLKFTGSIAAVLNIDTTTVIDSVQFKLGNESGNASTSDFSFTQLTESVPMLSIGSVLNPTLDISSMAECGSFTVYLIVYGHNNDLKLVAKDSTVFTRSASQCATEESSSSVAASEDPQLTAWNVTLSTVVTEANAVDLDSKTTYLSTDLVANAADIDLYIAREARAAVLYTNAAIEEGNVVDASMIAEETRSGFDYVSFNDPCHVSDFRYDSNALTISASDFELVTSYVVITSKFNAATGEGFFVILPHEVVNVGTNNLAITLTVLGVN